MRTHLALAITVGPSGRAHICRSSAPPVSPSIARTHLAFVEVRWPSRKPSRGNLRRSLGRAHVCRSSLRRSPSHRAHTLGVRRCDRRRGSGPGGLRRSLGRAHVCRHRPPTASGCAHIWRSRVVLVHPFIAPTLRRREPLRGPRIAHTSAASPLADFAGAHICRRSSPAQLLSPAHTRRPPGAGCRWDAHAPAVRRRRNLGAAHTSAARPLRRSTCFARTHLPLARVRSAVMKRGLVRSLVVHTFPAGQRRSAVSGPRTHLALSCWPAPCTRVQRIRVVGTGRGFACAPGSPRIAEGSAWGESGPVGIDEPEFRRFFASWQEESFGCREPYRSPTRSQSNPMRAHHKPAMRARSEPDALPAL